MNSDHTDSEWAKQKFRGTVKQSDSEWQNQRIREAIEEYDPALSTAVAYVEQIRKQLFATPGKRLDRPKDILPFIKAANLPLKPDVEQALMRAWSQSSYEQCTAYDREVLSEASDANLYPDSQSYLEIIERCGREFNWTRNSRGERKLQEQRRSQRRQRLIAIIANHKSTYPLWVKDHGQVRYFPVEGLANQSDETLECLALSVPQLREQMAGGRRETKPQAEEGVTLSVPAQNHVSVAGDEFLAHAQHPEREYTATEIKRMSREEYNRLIFSNGQSRGTARLNAITRILAGRKFGE